MSFLRSCVAIAGFVLAIAGQPATAANSPAQLCDQAADRAARLVGVPLDILLAVTRAETGRTDGETVQPWPWSVNVAGEGSWLETPDAAIGLGYSVIAEGKDNFDVGCFQLNYRWHGAAFPSLEAMFDPDANAEYAAKFLMQLYQSSGSWTQAVSDYHSKTDELAEVYLARIEALMGGGFPDEIASAEGSVDAQLPDAIRENLFPLLQPGDPGANGSIVPRTQSRGYLFAKNS